MTVAYRNNVIAINIQITAKLWRLIRQQVKGNRFQEW